MLRRFANKLRAAAPAPVSGWFQTREVCYYGNYSRFQIPRRRELLAQMGLTDFQVIPAVGEETADPNLAPPELAEALALHKARRWPETTPPTAIWSSARTPLWCWTARSWGKPRDAAHALEMLTALSGKRHHVYTGVALLRDGRNKSPTRTPRSTSAP